jgi:tripartite-type tricarboxylate transporter receptor subunit TctC
MLQRGQRGLWGILAVALILASAGWADRAQAQAKFPTRAVEIIQPFAAGGTLDLTTRQMAELLKKKWGVPVNVITKPGGKGIPAVVDVYQAKPDGYSMLADSSATSSMLAAATKDLPFDVANRTYIAMVNAIPYVIFIPASAPYKNLKEFIEGARKNIGSISYSAGPTALEYVLRQLFAAAGLDISKAKAVMCQGASEAVTLAAGGHISIGAAVVGTTIPAIGAQTIRPLLITAKARWPELPDLGTSAEQGYPDVDLIYWTGVSGPPKMPQNIAAIWDKAIQETLADPTYTAKLKTLGAVPFYHNAKDTAAMEKRDTERAMKLFQ